MNQSWNGATPLFQASQNGHTEVVQVLVKAGADLNQSFKGATPLFQASQNGHAKVVQVLVHAKADLNQSWNGATPLFQASQNGHAEVVEILVKKAGANPLIKCPFDALYTKSPLTIAKHVQLFRPRGPEAACTLRFDNSNFKARSKSLERTEKNSGKNRW